MIGGLGDWVSQTLHVIPNPPITQLPISSLPITQPSMPSTYIQLHQVNKTYQSKDGLVSAVNDVSFDINEAEFIAIVGPSGCGKTTILKMIAGLVPHSSGTITINGTAVNGPHTDLGIVFQDAVLLDWRDVLSNVMLQIDIRGLDRATHETRALELLKTTGLTGFEKKYPFELSGGMRQRASICRALVHDPPLLLMDEPFGALDALTREQISMDIQALWMEKRKTVLLITHSIPEAVLLSDRVIVMSPRPGTILEVIDIDLPRPRRLGQLPAQFNDYTDRIRHIFQLKGVLSFE